MKTLLSALLLTTSAMAQSEVVGFTYHVSTGTRSSFTSTTNDFVADYVETPPSFMPFREFDMDASGTTAYSFIHANSHIGPLNLTTGAVTSIGASGVPASSILGFTADPDGSTWYAMSRTGLDSQLYRGNMVAGSFVPVGPVHSGYAFMNLACDGSGNLFSVDVASDSLYRFNPITGALALVGPIGLDLNYAHGLDFDWSSGWLYAALRTTGGTECYFARLDPQTGAILDSEDTLVFDAQMRIAIAQPAPLVPVDFENFCLPANPNSTGSPTFLNAVPYAGAGSGVHLDAISGPPTNFGYFLVGSDFTEPGLDISFGRLCLSTTGGNVIGRYSLAGTPMNSIGVFNAFGVLENLSGTSTTGFGFDVPSTLPLTGSPLIMAGESWCFQVWHRDNAMGSMASNFSSGVRVTF